MASDTSYPAWLLAHPRIAPWVELTRVKKFAGTMVLFWPFAWSLTMISRTIKLPVTSYAVVLAEAFAGACLLHRCGGCIWNDILDRDFDLQVERTKHRPLADGRISVPAALLFLVFHLCVLVRMIWFTEQMAWQIGLVSIFLLPGIYPLMKRMTYWPQAWLGLAMNSGVPMASAILTKTVSRPTMVLSVGAWAWTIWYDTIYACQDKKDDTRAGIKSTALLFGDWTKPVLSFFATILISCLVTCGILNRAGLPYFIITVGGGAFLLVKELLQVNVDIPKSCWETFHRNGFVFGAVVWLGIALEYGLATWK
ncbi:4-hydroxybenzoate polyprenyl transferase [Gautieria morchelliformis]|nr:4-hydroxybenzoate polyprenyl transferase [Gautieria morchelliformis]